MTMTLALAVLLALSAGWLWGHSTARVRHVPIGATAADDAVALDLAEACCERWWTSAGTEHDTVRCTREGHRA